MALKSKLFTAMISTGFLVLLFFGLVALKCVSIISDYEQIFAEMLNGAKLPFLTRIVLQFSRFGGGLPSWVAVIAPTLFAMFALIRYRESAQSWILTVQVIAYLAILSAGIPFDLFLPMIETVKVLDGM